MRVAVIVAHTAVCSCVQWSIGFTLGPADGNRSRLRSVGIRRAEASNMLRGGGRFRIEKLNGGACCEELLI